MGIIYNNIQLYIYIRSQYKHLHEWIRIYGTSLVGFVATDFFANKRTELNQGRNKKISLPFSPMTLPKTNQTHLPRKVRNMIFLLDFAARLLFFCKKQDPDR